MVLYNSHLLGNVGLALDPLSQHDLVSSCVEIVLSAARLLDHFGRCSFEPLGELRAES